MTRRYWQRQLVYLVAVLAGKHVDLALVHAQLANVSLCGGGGKSNNGVILVSCRGRQATCGSATWTHLEEEDIGTLHGRVHDLGGSQVV